MKLHTYFKTLPKKNVEDWIIKNFFSGKKEIYYDRDQMWKLFGMRCTYYFSFEHLYFSFSFRQLPKEEEIYLSPVLVDNSLIYEMNNAVPIADMVRHNPMQTLRGKIQLLENTTGSTKIVIAKSWGFIPIKFKAIKSNPTAYIDQKQFLEDFIQSIYIMSKYSPDVFGQLPENIYDDIINN